QYTPPSETCPLSLHDALPILPAAAVPAPAATPAPKVAYTIDDAVRLMRSLPVERNADLVVRVVRTTLESLNVHVADIIGDAEQRDRKSTRLNSSHVSISYAVF